MYDLEFFIYHLRPYGIEIGKQNLNKPINFQPVTLVSAKSTKLLQQQSVKQPLQQFTTLPSFTDSLPTTNNNVRFKFQSVNNVELENDNDILESENLIAQSKSEINENMLHEMFSNRRKKFAFSHVH